MKTTETKNELVLVTYSELALKSKPVRMHLRKRLAGDLMTKLRAAGITSGVVEIDEGRIIIRNVPTLPAALLASEVFGVYSAMQAIEAPPDINKLVEDGVEIARRSLKHGDSFAVRARRVGNHSFTGRDVEIELGKRILCDLGELELTVDLTNPDKTIHVEIRKERAFIYSDLVRGPGGFPYGTQGRLVGLLSGGIDSPVAVWMMMKRGADVIPLFVDQRPYVGDDYFDKAISVARHIRRFVPRKYRIRIVPAGALMKSIVERAPRRITCVLCKRAMYMAACQFAGDIGAKGIVTGEDLGQVASQTLHNMAVLDPACPLPIYRPLVGFEKDQIVELARGIGTFELSTKKVQGCMAVPPKPVTRSKLDEVLKIEEEIGMRDSVASALAGCYSLDL